MPELQDTDGSNSWVVSGAHTPGGVPLLSNDTHRTIDMLYGFLDPRIRYEWRC